MRSRWVCGITGAGAAATSARLTYAFAIYDAMRARCGEGARQKLRHMCYNALMFVFGVRMAIEKQSTFQHDSGPPADSRERSHPPMLVIQPSRGWVALKLR